MSERVNELRPAGYLFDISDNPDTIWGLEVWNATSVNPQEEC